MRTHKTLYPATVAVGALALSACAGDPEEDSASAADEVAQAEETVEMEADYPPYEPEGLASEAVLIVSGTALATEHTVMTPHYEGDTPEENPLLGLSQEEQREAMEQDDGVAATAVTFHINDVYKGAVSPGDEIVIIQTGGVVDGVHYNSLYETIMTEDTDYLVFAGESHDGAYNVIGGPGGLYQDSGDGTTFEAVDPDFAPFETVTGEDAQTLAEEQ